MVAPIFFFKSPTFFRYVGDNPPYFLNPRCNTGLGHTLQWPHYYTKQKNYLYLQNGECIHFVFYAEHHRRNFKLLRLQVPQRGFCLSRCQGAWVVVPSMNRHNQTEPATFCNFVALGFLQGFNFSAFFSDNMKQPVEVPQPSGKVTVRFKNVENLNITFNGSNDKWLVS